jgi:membrane protein YqaA with SNARE-associated domain
VFVDVLSEEWGLWGLFFSAFISSTILPGGSEVLLIALALKSDHSSLSLLLVATLGNTLGGMSSWLLGRIIAWRFPADKLKQVGQRRAIGHMQRWGSPILLLSWLPVIGDPLCVAAGWLRVKPWLAMLFIALGKGGRYAVLLWLVN